MWGKGICFDTGLFNKGGSTREPFDHDFVRREMQFIHDDVHCTTVRITRGNLARVKTAATHAARVPASLIEPPIPKADTRGHVWLRLRLIFAAA
jgi:hypothetical protein